MLWTNRNFAYLLLLIFALVGCQQVASVPQKLESSNQRLEPLPQDPLIQVYFNHSQSSEYQETYRQQTRQGDDLEQIMADTILQAKSSVDVAVQELRLPKIAQALAEKQKAGVKVRLILENTYTSSWSKLTPTEIKKLTPRDQQRYNDFSQFVDINKDSQLTSEEINQRDALAILRNAQVPILDDRNDATRGSDLMHHKFIIVDNRFLIVTSANFTLSDTSGDFNNPASLGNANNLLKIDSPKLAAVFAEEFNIMWGDGLGGQPDSKFGLKKPLRSPQTILVGDSKITVHFSPTSPSQPWINSSNGLISKTLETATKNIDLALFVFSEQRLANTLEQRQQQNTQIRALIEPQFAYRSYSEALDMMGVTLSENCKYETDNKPWANPLTTVGVPTLAKGDLLHHKFAVIDNHTIITGSHNWSESANSGNDETVIIIENPTINAHYTREFNRLYNKIQLGIPPRIQAKINEEKQKCPQITTPSSNKAILTKINLNTATAAELETLPGVGKKLAQKIITARQQQKFTSLQDLEKISGISANTLEKWEGRITL
ncbi:MAG TPA: DUF655 domain-containing protein [Nostocaceae cyanobacterium]|nr:DUF655 domain-containing protein [Nostocaceae cyanobacterium]